MLSLAQFINRNRPVTLLRSTPLQSKPFFVDWLLGGGSEKGRDSEMGNWRTVESGLTVAEYAKRVCKELGWPFAGNLTLLCDCLTSLAYMKGLDVQGGFFSLMEAVEHAKRTNVRVDRWFFQDGRYVEMEPEELELPDVLERTPNAAGTLIERKPN